MIQKEKIKGYSIIGYDEVTRAAFMELQEQKKELLELMHKRVDEL